MGEDIESPDRRRTGTFERRVQGLMMTGVLALTIWIANTTYQTSIRLTQLDERFVGFVNNSQLVNSMLERRCNTNEDDIKQLFLQVDDVQERLIKLEAVCPRESNQ